jgi:hypothetical protein
MARRRSKDHLANLAKLKKEHAEQAKEKERIAHVHDLANAKRARTEMEE